MRQPIETQLYLPPQADSPIILPFENQAESILVGNKIADYSQNANMRDPRQAKALQLLVLMTKDKRRKVSKKPTAVHSLNVGIIIAQSFPEATDMQIAALLHDGVEDKWLKEDDSTVTLADIEQQFGSQVALDVGSLTADEQTKNKSKELISKGYRDSGYGIRKEEALLKAIRGGINTTEIKLADLTDNSGTTINDYHYYERHSRSGMESFRFFNASPFEIVNRYVQAAKTVSDLSLESGTAYVNLPMYLSNIHSLLRILPDVEFQGEVSTWRNLIERLIDKLGYNLNNDPDQL